MILWINKILKVLKMEPIILEHKLPTNVVVSRYVERHYSRILLVISVLVYALFIDSRLLVLFIG